MNASHGSWHKSGRSSVRPNGLVTRSPTGLGWQPCGCRLERASGHRAKTLAIPGYAQTNSYGCGAVAAVMVVQHFQPEMPFGAVYDAVARCQNWALNPANWPGR